MRVVLTDHARERCAEMGIGTKLVKRALREPECVRPQEQTSIPVAKYENILVPFRVDDEGTRVAITVMWWSPDERISREL